MTTFTGLMKPVLSKHMEALQRVFKDRHLTVGASEIGRCARMIWYVKHHPSAKAIEAEESFGASHRGNMIEWHTVVPALRRHYGANILYSGKDQRTFVSGVNSATPDGLLINQPKDLLAEFGIKDIGKSRCILIEIKSIDPRIQLRGPKAEHARQANQQLGIIREMGELWSPEYCLLMYVNASFLDDVTEFVIPFDVELYKRQKKRAAMILDAKTAREMKPEGWIKGGKECEYCQFSDACTELRTDVPAESANKAPPQFVAEIKELAFAERDLDTRASELEEQQREIQLQIKDKLREKQLRGIKEPDIVVSWYPVKARITYDMEALRLDAEAVGFNVAPYEKVGNPGDGLRITVKSLAKPVMKGEPPKAKLTGAKVTSSGKAKRKT